MPSYYDQINSLGPKIWYRFNETTGTPTNSGSLTSTLTTSGPTPLLLNEPTDVDGRSIYFNDSATSLSDMPEFSLFDDRSFTVETWFKTTSTFVDGINYLPIWALRGRTTATGTSNNTVQFQAYILGKSESIGAVSYTHLRAHET